MYRIAAATFVVRPGPRGDQVLLALRRPQSLTQPGYRTFIADPLTAADHADSPIETVGDVDGAVLRALSIAAKRALALHAGLWPLTDQRTAKAHDANCKAARRRLLTREATFFEALANAQIPKEHVAAMEALGLGRTPPYLARPIDVVLFGLYWPDAPEPQVDGPSFCEGAFVDVDVALERWASGEWALGAFEVEALRLWRQSATVNGNVAAHWQQFRERWQSRHASVDDVVSADASPHVPSTQTPWIEAFPVRSPTLAPATHTNCYAVGRSRVAVIDPGTPYADEQPRLLQWLEQRQAQGSTIEQVWLTHHHADHIGAANLLRDRFGATVMAHPETAHAVQPSITVDALVHDEQVLSLGDIAFRALFTPGHAAGHLCFFDDTQQTLFSGDNVLGTGTSIVVPSPHGDMRAYMRNLRRILALKPKLLFPGHGPPAARATDRIVDTLRQREAREQRLLELLTESPTPLDLDTLLARLYRGIAPAQRKLAALSLRAHAEKLVAEGVIGWVPGAQASLQPI